jgi:hypothetical protein
MQYNVYVQIHTQLAAVVSEVGLHVKKCVARSCCRGVSGDV